MTVSPALFLASRGAPALARMYTISALSKVAWDREQTAWWAAVQPLLSVTDRSTVLVF